MEKPQSGFSFRVMAFMFRLRDLFKPRAEVLKEAGIRPDAQVLDFGCGPGSYILPLSRLVGPRGRIYALDMNSLAIQAVKDLATRKKIDNLETIVSRGDTGLADTSMDFVLLYDVLHHLNQPEAVLAELHRVLKPEGILSMSDHHMKDAEITAAVTASGHFRLLKRDEKSFSFSRAQ